MVFFERVQQSFRRLHWKLTLSYTAVTVGALLLSVLILGLVFFSTILAPPELLTPEVWVNIFSEQIPPDWRYVLAQTPVDTTMVNLMLALGEKPDFQVSHLDLLRVGDLQLTARMVGQINILMVSPDGMLLGTSNPNWVSSEAVGQPLDMTVLPGLEDPMNNALAGETDPGSLFVDILPHEQFFLRSLSFLIRH